MFTDAPASDRGGLSTDEYRPNHVSSSDYPENGIGNFASLDNPGKSRRI
jgi:hypothetical protein